MNRKLLLSLLLLLFQTELFYAESTKKIDKSEMNRIVLWEGEITGIYKDKGAVRSLISHNPEWVGANFEEIKAGILKKKKFELRQKVTNKKIGYFIVSNVELEKQIDKNKKTDYQILMNGKFDLGKKSHYSFISNDFTISMARYEESYLDPSAFFKDNITSPQKTYIHPIDKKEMVLIPSGVFIFGQGSDGELDNYNPAFQSPDDTNLTEIASFYIDKYEVTNEEYARYLRDTNAKPPLYWINGKYPDNKEHHPVISLSYREVERYATWAGKRLPTEFEWEKAARGQGLTRTLKRDESYTIELQTIKYPFGNKFDSLLCNTKESKIADTVSVYELAAKGASPYGVIGMCGNAAEWTSSWYTAYEGHFTKNPAFGKQYKVIRGGSFFDDKKTSTVYFRSYGGNPNLAEDRRAGFRLVKDLN
jgi:formylglycine-generating enzyme required for sulfatase activity